MSSPREEGRRFGELASVTRTWLHLYGEWHFTKVFKPLRDWR